MFIEVNLTIMCGSGGDVKAEERGEEREAPRAEIKETKGREGKKKTYQRRNLSRLCTGLRGNGENRKEFLLLSLAYSPHLYLIHFLAARECHSLFPQSSRIPWCTHTLTAHSALRTYVYISTYIQDTYIYIYTYACTYICIYTYSELPAIVARCACIGAI